MFWTQGATEAASSSRLTPERAGIAQAIVAHAYGIELYDMRADTRRDKRAALARQIAMYLCHVVFRMTVHDIAIAFLRSKSTAHHALSRIEELRDDPELDRTLQFLESMLRSATGRPA
ncbi:MAG TPA: helix-turn-helix domain-containing protein [Rhizomicrobium sp.]|nr:helix-turn-helix domain-containing protein [Rhizomicrobium sp.]